MERRNKKVKSKGNGEGTIYYSETLKKWVAQYVEPSGKRKTLTQKKNEKVSDFKNRFNKILVDINQNMYIEKSTKTLGDLIEEILEYKFNTNKIGERTYRRTKDTIKVIKNNEIDLYNIPIQKITKKQLKTFFSNITIYSNSTIDKVFQIIHKAFKKAIVQKIIIDDPFLDEEEIFKPKSDKNDKVIEPLTIKEERKLLKIFETFEKDSIYKNAILLMLYTGLRIGEVLALNINTDIDFETGYLYVTKTISKDKDNKIIISNKTKTFDKNKNANRAIKLSPIVTKILKLQLKKSICNIENLLFYKNGPIPPVNVDSYLYRINKKYNICKSLSCHVFRHTYATRCIESGMSAKVLQKKLGHANISTTLDTYASVLSKFEDNEDEKYNAYSEKENLIINL